MASSTIFPFMDLNLHASDSHYAFTSPSNPTAPTLIVDRPSGDLRLTDSKISGVKRVSSISGILGFIKLRLDRYIITITKSKPVGKLKGSIIYKVLATEFLSLRERPLHDKDEDTYIGLLQDVLRTGPMYFSYNLDLTSNFQRQAKSNPSAPLWQRADERFFWNRFLCTDLIDFRSGGGNAAAYRAPTGQQPGVDAFILPVMCGMFNMTKTSINGNPLTFMLVTRRSRHRIGTRYFSRGLDERGNVSNFNETEQAIVLNDSDGGPSGGAASSNGSLGANWGRDVQILAYVQTRGSVPVFWAEVNKLKYTPDLQIRGIDSAVDAAKLHFEQQINIYGDNYMVNLVNHKGREKRIKDAYEQMVRKLQSNAVDEKSADTATSEKLRVVESAAVKQQFDRLHYVYFDFHTETKGLKWHRTQLLLDELHEPLMNMQYFHGVYSLSDRTGRVDVRNTQRGVVRTNCMDCLDRTNVVQSMLGRFAINRMLHDLQLLSRDQTAQQDLVFEHSFRNIWADNADVVSKSYSGSGALKTDFTRTGERTKAGALQDLNNSITRYVRNNFADGPRQDGFDILSGAYLPATSSAPGTFQFVDRRPLLVQSIPYILTASIFFLSVATATRRLPDATVWPLRILMILFTFVAAYCANFMWSYGTLFVNWPKLNTPPWATESYQEALNRSTHDPVLGPIVKHQRSMSEGRPGHLEEGKKRIE